MVEPLSIPEYSRVAWLFGARLRAPEALGADTVAELAKQMAEGAESRGLEPVAIHGAYGAPFLPNDEVILGAVLNGAPIVRERAEMREGVLGKHHAATQARFELRARIHSSSQEDLSVEESWIRHVEQLAAQVRADSGIAFDAVPLACELDEELYFDDQVGPCAWYLASRGGEGAGALVRGTILPNPGAPYGDDVLETIECRDEDGAPQARLVGRVLLRVGPDQPLVCLGAPLTHGSWRSDVGKRITALTGKARAVSFYLVSTG